MCGLKGKQYRTKTNLFQAATDNGYLSVLELALKKNAVLAFLTVLLRWKWGRKVVKLAFIGFNYTWKVYLQIAICLL